MYFVATYRMDEWIEKTRAKSANRREVGEFLNEMKAQLFYIIGVFLLKKDIKVKVNIMLMI